MLQQRLPVLIAALWWGGITGISFVAVPMLFAQLENPALAGGAAAKLFAFQSHAGLVLGLALLMILRRGGEDGGRIEGSTITTLGFVLFAMLLALLQQYGVAHNIVTARASGGNLRLWHGLGSAMVFGQWVCAAVVLWRVSGVRLRA